jgi:multidrug efflux system membrane fusion protein
VDRSKPQTGQSSGAPRTGNGGGSAAGSGAPAGGPGSGNTQAAGTGGGRRGGAGGGAGQTSYPVEVATVVVDSTQGPDVIIKSGIKAGDQVVTDGQERLQAGAHVVPHASADTAAARAAARGNASGKGKAPAAGNPAAGDFSNGRDSDRDTGPIPSTLRNGQNTGQGGRHRDGQGNAPSGGQGNGRPGGE